MATAAEFVGLMFFERSVAHKEHLTTGLYSTHMALETFYDEIVDLADTFAESYQGKYEILNDLQLTWVAPEYDSIEDFIRDSMEWIQTNRYMIAPQNDTPLQNIIDEVITLHAQTLDRLRRK